MLWHVVQVGLILFFFASAFALVALLQYFARRSIDEEDNRRPKGREVVRGQKLVSLKEAAADLEKNAPPAASVPRTLFLSGLWLSRDEEANNKGTIGVVGTGKTKSASVTTPTSYQATILRAVSSP